jgi:hypothetical protein
MSDLSCNMILIIFDNKLWIALKISSFQQCSEFVIKSCLSNIFKLFMKVNLKLKNFILLYKMKVWNIEVLNLKFTLRTIIISFVKVLLLNYLKKVVFLEKNCCWVKRKYQKWTTECFWTFMTCCQDGF